MPLRQDRPSSSVVKVLKRVFFNCSPCFSACTMLLVIGVSIGPGLTALTWILRNFRSTVQVRANDRIATLVALSTLDPSNPLDPAIEVLKMISQWRLGRGVRPLALPVGTHDLHTTVSVTNPIQPAYNYAADLTYQLIVKPLHSTAVVSLDHLWRL